MNEKKAREELTKKFGSEIFNESSLDSEALLENCQRSDLETIRKDLDRANIDEKYTKEEQERQADTLQKTIGGRFFLTEKLLRYTKGVREGQLIGGYMRAREDIEGHPVYENLDMEGEVEGQPDFETKSFLQDESCINDNSPDFFLSALAYTPKPLSIVNGKPRTGKKKVALMLVNYGLERGYFDRVASNIEVENFDTVKSIEELDTWLAGSGRRLFILGGGDRYLTPQDKGTVIYRRFIKLLRKARDTQNKVWIIAEERPAERKGLAKSMEEYSQEYKDWKKAWKEDFVFLRKFQELSEELEKFLVAWIGTVGVSSNVEKNIAFEIHQELAGWNDEYLLSGYVPQYDEIGLEDFTPDFREEDPCDFFKEPPEEESEKESENSLSPLDVELYLEHKEGKSYRKMAEERNLGRSAIHQRVKKVEEARGEE